VREAGAGAGGCADVLTGAEDSGHGVRGSRAGVAPDAAAGAGRVPCP
jgi:hypothetical protein